MLTFFTQPAGFDIGETGLFLHDATQPLWHALLVGLGNTLRASLPALLLATLLGLMLALGRRSASRPLRLAAGITVDAIVDKTRPTTNKNAIVVGGYRLLKVDTLDNSSISDAVLERICASVKSRPTEAVVFADFRHGIFNRRTIPTLVDAIPAGVFRVADSQVASRWGNITDFKNFDLITPNEREARFALADQDLGIRPLASNLYEQAGCKMLILKLGERGVLAYLNPDHHSSDSYFVLESFVDQIVDPVGAGDALLAYSTLAMVVARDATQATILGSIAAACECEFDGNIPISPDNVRAKINAVENQLHYRA